MHEIALIRNMFRTLESEYPAENLETMTAINLKIGLLSNVEPVLLHHAFVAVTASKQKYRAVKLNIELVPVEIYCEDCQVRSQIENYRFICHVCKNPCNNLLRGTELHIDRVSFAKNRK